LTKKINFVVRREGQELISGKEGGPRARKKILTKKKKIPGKSLRSLKRSILKQKAKYPEKTCGKEEKREVH